FFAAAAVILFHKKYTNAQSVRERALFGCPSQALSGVPALCAGSGRGAQNRPGAPTQKRMNIQNRCIKSENIHFTLPPKVTKRKQKPKNSKSGLDTGGVCYNAFERKGPSFQPVLGLYLLYTIRRKIHYEAQENCFPDAGRCHGCLHAGWLQHCQQ